MFSGLVYNEGSTSFFQLFRLSQDHRDIICRNLESFKRVICHLCRDRTLQKNQ